jgi:drug/metabolite transporter (DMT)-like permease
MGILMAGTVPLFAALGWWLVARDPLGPARLAGFALILAGVAALGWRSVSGDFGASWRGDLLFLLAAMLWAAYTVAFRFLKLTPWQGAALINTWSALLLLPLLLVFGAPKLLTAPWSDLALQAVWQGVIAGFLGLFVYGVAIARLGPGNAALFGALVPVLSTFGGHLFLGEPVTLATLAAAFMVAAGIALASGWRWPGGNKK